MQEKKISWEQIDQLSQILLSEIKNEKNDFDGILAVARGGLVLSSILAYALNIKNIYLINPYIYEGKTKKKPEILGAPEHIDAQNLLVVDDIIDSGDTFREVNDVLSGKVPSLSWAVLFSKEPPLTQGFIAEYVLKDQWLVFPWD